MSWPGFQESHGYHSHPYYERRYHGQMMHGDPMMHGGPMMRRGAMVYEEPMMREERGMRYHNAQGHERSRFHGAVRNEHDGMLMAPERDGYRYEREDPLYYTPAMMQDGIPDQGLGRMTKGRTAHTKERVETFIKPKAKSTQKEAFDNFLNGTHAKMSSKYAESKVSDDPRRLRDPPVRISASCVDEEIPKKSGVIIVNENKFARVQESKFARNELLQKKFHSAAIAYIRGFSDLDFSMITNPNVAKKVSSHIMTYPDSKVDRVKMSPYIMWDPSTSSSSPKLRVDNARGFPSIENDDDVIEAGYMVTVLDKAGIRIHGAYGGKEGKVMQYGQSLYFGDALVYPSRAHRMPVWIRLASNKPSELVGKNVSVASMDAKMIPLRTGMVASEMTSYDGKAVRKLKIDEVDGKSSAGRSSGEDTRVINASLQIDFA